MERKRKLEVYEAPPQPAQNGAPAVLGGGIGFQQTAAPPAGSADGSLNPYTGHPYSARYHQILAGRKGELAVGCKAARRMLSGVVALHAFAVRVCRRSCCFQPPASSSSQ